MRQVVLILFAAAFTYLAASAAGRMLLARLRLPLFRSEERFFGFLAGAAILSTLVFLATCLRLAYTGVFFALGAALIVAAWRTGAWRSTADRLPPLGAGWQIAFWTVYGVYALFYLANALAPESSPDGAMYHVALPARYLREHGFSWTTKNLLANLSEGAEMLFLFAFAFGRHSAAAMVHFLFTLATPLGMLSYARRIGYPVAGVVGAVLFFASPIVGKDGVSAYVDVAAAAAVFGVFYAVEIWRERRSMGLLALAGLLGGFAYAVKYTAGLALAYALGYAVFYLWRSRRPVWRAALVICACGAAMMAPWMLKNVYVAGNPFSPFANRLFPNPVVFVSTEAAYSYVMRTMNSINPKWSEILVETTLRGGTLQGLVGPVFWLTPLMLLTLRRGAGRRIALAAALFTALYPTSIATRFLVPPLPFLSLGLGMALSMWRPAAAAVLALHAVLSWPAVMALYTGPYAWRLAEAPWRAALRRQSEEQFLTERLPGYAMGRVLERVVPPGETVFAFDAFQQAYHSREVITGWQSSFGQRLADTLQTPYTGYLVPTWWHDFRFTPQSVRKIRLAQTGAGKEDNWSVSELRFFLNGKEVARDPAWRLKARPYPWDVEQAFDGNPATRWSSGEVLRAGMYVEVDFGAATQIDEVRAECSLDQVESRMRLEVEPAPGQWAPLQAEDRQSLVQELGGLRRFAVESMRRKAVRWLLVSDDAGNAADYRDRTAEWGLVLAAHEGQSRLYRIR